MKKNGLMRKKGSLGLVMLAVLFCAGTAASAAEYVKIDIFPKHVGVFTVDGKQQFVAYGLDAQNKPTNITTMVTWESSDPDRVDIDENGLATVKAGVTYGQVVITAIYPKSGKAIEPVNLLLGGAKK